MKNTITSEIIERWKRGDRFHLVCCGEGADTKDILIGSYDECLAAAGRRYDFDKSHTSFFLLDITEELLEHVTFLLNN